MYYLKSIVGYGLEGPWYLKFKIADCQACSLKFWLRDFFKNLGQHKNHKTDFAKNFNPICFLLSLARKKCNEHSAI